MESVRNFFHYKRHEAALAYEAISNSQEKEHLVKDEGEIYLCNHCGKSVHGTSPTRSTRLIVGLKVVVGACMLALWTALVGVYLARSPHLLRRMNGFKPNLVDLCKISLGSCQETEGLWEAFPIVPTDFQSDSRFVDSEPFDSPFWLPFRNNDSVEVSGWNYYGNDWIWLEKGSPYEIPGGRPLIPLYERDSWMKDYLGYISAYQHEIHCLGIIKNVLNSYKDGNPVTEAQNHHANKHCLEVVRHVSLLISMILYFTLPEITLTNPTWSVMCHPDLTLAVPEFDTAHKEHEPYWGGEKHMCRDQNKVHEFLATRNMGFDTLIENGKKIMKAWSWPLPTDTVKSEVW
ncbi:hypothetical protein P280DRAFT_518479 [Massarina eburnea CBS 473.64]|uniref:Uncharacterized protein n=1 Tax=Massarina eburnea CBS 473.64 TaxID=1395130 RepID=A0A6A6RWU8_9PLEO|nr:hypothetical protein P280DRAFT_518479 [Massarina eburnea CBS 473.64]